ncbi:hypothetical protein PHSY_005006 [Pseudozyma hubeiensis SY62]|uniref:Uncharacterized protein n=1 Tax=Pseudozyma hubeiensis (strain SY62) TaxID=1305764 RepID=R9PH58_PSEHS|nr:hypothetical protein PHSY_005006 [Pseudozyma hubeiensis SY62]GAC97420.1 hypothetical protein PHSY_005006 [Pseudozyma hubeiensis SY62]
MCDDMVTRKRQKVCEKELRVRTSPSLIMCLRGSAWYVRRQDVVVRPKNQLFQERFRTAQDGLNDASSSSGSGSGRPNFLSRFRKSRPTSLEPSLLDRIQRIMKADEYAEMKPIWDHADGVSATLHDDEVGVNESCETGLQSEA